MFVNFFEAWKTMVYNTSYEECFELFLAYNFVFDGLRLIYRLLIQISFCCSSRFFWLRKNCPHFTTQLVSCWSIIQTLFYTSLIFTLQTFFMCFSIFSWRLLSLLGESQNSLMIFVPSSDYWEELEALNLGIFTIKVTVRSWVNIKKRNRSRLIAKGARRFLMWTVWLHREELYGGIKEKRHF